MLSVALLLLAVSTTTLTAQPFNITHFVVPYNVLSDQNEVIIECHYDANFTILNWFKGPNEFFRYKPGTAPSTKTFPILGVGKVDVLSCGQTACRLKLGALTEDASGLYRCDIERSSPPYLFESRSAVMNVHGHKQRKPLLEGLAPEFGEGDEIKAYCRGIPDSEFRWYINAREVEEMRGSQKLTKTSSRLIFSGVPPTMTVQCAEFRSGILLGSEEVKARWKEYARKYEPPLEQRNNSTLFQNCILSLILFIFCFIL